MAPLAVSGCMEPLGWFEAFTQAQEWAVRGGVPSLVPVSSRGLIALSISPVQAVCRDPFPAIGSNF